MAAWFYRTIFIIGSRFRGTPVLPYLRELEESQWWDAERFREHQHEELRDLVSHAERHSPFYREIFRRNGLDATTVSLDDLKRLPAVSKDEVRRSFADIQNPGKGGALIPSKTSGSTGEPLKFYRGSRWDAQHRAAVARGYGWYGVRPWTRSGLLWGLPPGYAGLLKARAGDMLQNRFREKRFDLSAGTLEDFYSRLSRAGYLEGYSSMIYELARFINARHPDDEKPPLSLVKGTSEKIYPRYHEESLKAFGRRMTSEYGAAEAGIIAFGCPEGNMHINMEHVIVEEEDGQIIVTNLLSHSFPFIRYRLGDHITMAGDADCPCGRKSPVISEVTGRVGKKIYGAGGNAYPSLTVYYIINALYGEFPDLARLQAVQESAGRLDFLAVIEGGDGLPTAVEKRLKALVEEYYGRDIEARILPVGSIADEGGKRLDFVSRVPEENREH